MVEIPFIDGINPNLRIAMLQGFYMHDLSTAISICESAVEIADKNQATIVTSILVVNGRFSSLSNEQVKSSLEHTKSNYPLLQKAKISIRVDEGEIECLDCGYTGNEISSLERGELHDMAPIVECKKCKSTNIAIISGMSTYLDKINVKRR